MVGCKNSYKNSRYTAHFLFVVTQLQEMEETVARKEQDMLEYAKKRDAYVITISTSSHYLKHFFVRSNMHIFFSIAFWVQ